MQIANILLVDDHPVLLQGLKLILRGEAGIQVVGEAQTADEAYAQVQKLNPDLVLLDFSLQDSNGLGFITKLRETHPNIKILVYSMHDEKVYGERVLRAGAHGYLMKEETSQTLVSGIRTALAGGLAISPAMREVLPGILGGNPNTVARTGVSSLTNRELQVFEGLGKGFGVKIVAIQLGLSAKTVETHCANIKRKLGLQNAHHLFQEAARWELSGG